MADLSLRGKFKRFYPLKFPGADDLSRWMSMAIYYSKIHACSKVFQLSEEEKTDTLLATQFTALFYGRHWFKASLAAPEYRAIQTFVKNVAVVNDIAERVRKQADTDLHLRSSLTD